jgi:hypothetical protein
VWQREKKRTLRPDLYDDKNTNAAKQWPPEDERVLENLTRTARKMQEGMVRAGERSADGLLKSRLQGRRDVPGRLERVFEAVAAILYDQEWTGRPYRATSNAVPVHNPYYPDIQLAYACDYVFEHMLLIDYGFPAAPIRSPMLIPQGITSWRPTSAISKIFPAFWPPPRTCGTKVGFRTQPNGTT